MPAKKNVRVDYAPSKDGKTKRLLQWAHKRADRGLVVPNCSPLHDEPEVPTFRWDDFLYGQLPPRVRAVAIDDIDVIIDSYIGQACLERITMRDHRKGLPEECGGLRQAVYKKTASENLIDISPRSSGKTTRLLNWIKGRPERRMVVIDHATKLVFLDNRPKLVQEHQIFSYADLLRAGRADTGITEYGLDDMDSWLRYLGHKSNVRVDRVSITSTHGTMGYLTH